MQPFSSSLHLKMIPHAHLTHWKESSLSAGRHFVWLYFLVIVNSAIISKDMLVTLCYVI